MDGQRPRSTDAGERELYCNLWGGMQEIDGYKQGLERIWLYHTHTVVVGCTKTENNHLFLKVQSYYSDLKIWTLQIDREQEGERKSEYNNIPRQQERASP